MAYPPIHCLQCNTQLPLRENYGSTKRKYCSKKCRELHYYGPDELQKRTMSKRSKRGAASELIVCADLLRLGFDVYKSVSHQSSCDIIAIKGDRIYRVEVTTARRNRHTGRVSYAEHDEKRYDILALVLSDYEITYIPPIPN